MHLVREGILHAKVGWLSTCSIRGQLPPEQLIGTCRCMHCFGDFQQWGSVCPVRQFCTPPPPPCIASGWAQRFPRTPEGIVASDGSLAPRLWTDLPPVIQGRASMASKSSSFPTMSRVLRPERSSSDNSRHLACSTRYLNRRGVHFLAPSSAHAKRLPARKMFPVQQRQPPSPGCRRRIALRAQPKK